jgi:hypothetical protein
MGEVSKTGSSSEMVLNTGIISVQGVAISGVWHLVAKIPKLGEASLVND